jgi:hypothetical protein
VGKGVLPGLSAWANRVRAGGLPDFASLIAARHNPRRLQQVRLESRLSALIASHGGDRLLPDLEADQACVRRDRPDSDEHHRADAPAGIDTIIAELFEVLRSGTASVSAAAAASGGRSCGGCATARISLMHKLKSFAGKN